MNSNCLNLTKRIPSKPKIPLDNYLNTLISKNDAKRTSVYLKGQEKCIQKIWAEIVKRHF